MILDLGPATRHAAADVVVVGSGAAGLSAAVALADAGADVALVTKDALGDGATAWAQGGLAAAIDPADSPDAHARDTLTAGAGLCEAPVVAELAAAAPGAIARLQALGVSFDRAADGSPALGLEGGHLARRIVHAGGDASGAAVVRALAAAARRGVTRVLEHALAVDAFTDADRAVAGLTLLDADGAVRALRAPAVVLATGGIGRAWPVTSNPDGATGDGLALALRAGALVRDPEFVQFHPTVVVPAPSHRRPGARTALVSEAVRGEGARLRDVHGRPVMDGVHPLGDLAPRDVVAAAIHRRMAETGADHVLLDATGLGARTWETRFPTILALCEERGVDPRREPIPVAPAAHYHCGGVLADLDGVTSVPGLSAVGEVASTGVQGANRLASNSVTEALIAGRRVAERICAEPPGATAAAGDERPVTPVLGAARIPEILALTGAGSGVLRDAAGLRSQLHALATIAPTRARTAARGTPRRADVEASNLQVVSTLVATAALARTESRGCHRRADFPAPAPEWQTHQLLALRDGRLERVDALVTA